ncbi:hypothetical protein BASA50_007147 [Batrachochytrium salamandrivorans]|uniref:Uncharacterized protein n=1 Tax=Batrachochytrium salamandrivorans TaxID=1357716 RepID=A0ABQ8F7T0_9FUNG|nr:hypothetical protein BASA50_007147 [Batrachochytrium salamandrivorans]
MHSSLRLGLLYLAVCISNVFANPGYQSVIANPNGGTAHQITLKMAADDYYEMWFVGDYYGGSVSEVNMGSWEEIRTYQKTVYGNGPWLIAVKVYDFGGHAGLFASTLLDGAPYSTTGSPNNKFRMTTIPPPDSWNTNPRFDERGWVTQLVDSCSNGATTWPRLYSRLEKALSGEKPRAMWFPDCKAVGTPDKPKEIWFRLVVTADNVIQRRGLPGQGYASPQYPPVGQPTYGGNQQSTYWGNQQSTYGGNRQSSYGGNQQSQSPMLNSQYYRDANSFGYTGNNNQGSLYTPNNRGGYNGYPQWGQLQTSFVSKNSPALASQYNVQGNRMGMLPQQNGGNSWSTIPSRPQYMGGMQQSSYYDSRQAYRENYQRTQTHTIKVVIAVDDEYVLFIDSTTYIGPKNTYESRSFSVIKTYTQTVTGNGPWQIAIHAIDTGWVAGMFATVWVDDKVFSTTAQADNKFRMTKDQQGPGWNTSPYFFEGKWKAQTEDVCASRNYKWSTFLPEMDRMTAPRAARAMWFPNCESSASESSPSIMYFRLTANAYTP